MKNVTFSIDEGTLKAGREYARRHGISLNALLRRLLKGVVKKDSAVWLEECFGLMDKAGGNSGKWKWSREDLYNE